MKRCLYPLLFWLFVCTGKLMSGEGKKLPIIIAHRGASLAAPENTLAAIRAALGTGAAWVEWDTRVTADGQLLLQHDDTLKRFTGEKVAVEGLTFAQARQYDVGAWFDEEFTGESMPGLGEAIEAALPDLVPLIERKSGSAEQHFKVLHGMGVLEKVVVQAFDWDFLRELRKLAPALRLGALGKEELSDEKLLAIAGLKAGFVGWKAADLKRGDVERLHGIGVDVAVWTVDDPGEVRKFVSWGVDAIITNDPANTRKVLELEMEN